MRRSLCALLAGTALLSSCSLYSSTGQDNRQGHYLINTRSLPNYVRTVPIPENTSDLVVVKSVRLETKHRLSSLDFIYQAKPRPYHERLYLMDFQRKRLYATGTPERPYRWIHELGGRAYRYLYTGKFVAFGKDWKAEQDWETRKEMKKEAKRARSLHHAHALASPEPAKTARGPLDGEIIQQDENSMTEMLPSGAYVFHPAKELEAGGYRYTKKSGWTKPR